jgi:rRNA-processing protein FCF1
MISFLLDTNTINEIGKDKVILERVVSTIESCKISLFITHVQIDEINEIKEKDDRLKFKLLNFAKIYCNCTPTRGAVVQFSEVDGCTIAEEGEIDLISKKKVKMIRDALIALTAQNDMDFFVTNDDKLSKSMIQEFPFIRILSNNEFFKIIYGL